MSLAYIIVNYTNSGTTLYTLLRNMSKKSAAYLDEVEMVPEAIPTRGRKL